MGVPTKDQPRPSPAKAKGQSPAKPSDSKSIKDFFAVKPSVKPAIKKE
jgi:hypothetical protein